MNTKPYPPKAGPQTMTLSSRDLTRLADAVSRRLGKLILDELSALMDEWIPTERVAKMLGFSPKYISGVAEQMGGIKMGRGYMFSRRNINTYMHERARVREMTPAERIHFSMTDPLPYNKTHMREATDAFRAMTETPESESETPKPSSR